MRMSFSALSGPDRKTLTANALIGAIPVFGDIFSISFRSNAKNADLLERYAGSETRRARDESAMN